MRFVARAGKPMLEASPSVSDVVEDLHRSLPWNTGHPPRGDSFSVLLVAAMVFERLLRKGAGSDRIF
jgi:hypothetical protein